MQLTSTLALLAATSNALAVQGSYAHNACGNDDYFELCREMVYLTRVWDYGDNSWDLEDYQNCLDSALVNELIYCHDWVTND